MSKPTLQMPKQQSVVCLPLTVKTSQKLRNCPNSIYSKYFRYSRIVKFGWNCEIGQNCKNIARGTTDPGYWVHNSNHPNSRSMLIVESTLLTWSALFDLFFAFEYFYKTQEVVFLVFCIPLFLLIKMLFAIGDGLSYGLNTLGPLCLWQCFFLMLPVGI